MRRDTASVRGNCSAEALTQQIHFDLLHIVGGGGAAMYLKQGDSASVSERWYHAGRVRAHLGTSNAGLNVRLHTVA